MTPEKSAPPPARTALVPQRRPGKQRVAELLRAGADVFAERGFEAATMAEIASRAGAPIGSLYRFFPNKDALADALMQRYGEMIDEAFAAIDARPGALTTDAFADTLLTSLVALRDESPAVVCLLDARPDGMARRNAFHEAFRRHIIAKLTQRDPSLGAQIDDVAVVLLQNMKTMKSLDPEHDAGAIAELTAMNRLYLRDKLSSPR
ncbi:MAG: TetR/AcrR family transcriptional regulator [Candidatus Eremiobacteraeota bacterium]|nr:TetR/AcrR family transcriptional regulator [Candidatus Eremiobacteraeota bacterium]